MGIVKTIKGDILQLHRDGKAPIILQGCNCFKMQGSGLAGQIAQQFPEVYQADKDYPLRPLRRLGTYSVGETKFGIILNCYTQYLPGKHFEYAALKQCLDRLEAIGIKRGKPINLHVPQIGCGIGGGNWDIVQELFNMYEHLLFTVVEYGE